MPTKEQLRIVVRQWADDPNAARWDDQHLDVLIGMEYDRLWGEILDAAPWWASALENAVPQPPGWVKLSGLQQRLFRLQLVQRNEQSYTPADPRDVLLHPNGVATATPFSYVLYGDELWIFPLDTAAVTLRYSYFPKPFTELEDGEQISWPEGHVEALGLHCAAKAMLKGSVEDIRAMRDEADAAFGKLLSAVARRQLGPVVVYSPDSAMSWGST